MSVQRSGLDERELLTPGAVAAVLFVDPKTVTRWARAGKIDSIRTPGGHRRYRRSDVEALRFGDSGQGGGAAGSAPLLPPSSPPDTPPVPSPGPRRLMQVTVHDPPWAAADLAEVVASALEVEAEASIAAVWQAQAELEAAQSDAHEAAARARQARARADAEHQDVARRYRPPLRFPTQHRPLPPHDA